MSPLRIKASESKARMLSIMKLCSVSCFNDFITLYFFFYHSVDFFFECRLMNRVVIHLDLDAFYAQVEMVRLGVSPTEPLCVLQWHSLIAVNYPARDHGIKRHCTFKEARALCPSVRLVHVATLAEGDSEPRYHQNPSKATHKVSLDFYRSGAYK